MLWCFTLAMKYPKNNFKIGLQTRVIWWNVHWTQNCLPWVDHHIFATTTKWLTTHELMPHFKDINSWPHLLWPSCKIRLMHTVSYLWYDINWVVSYPLETINYRLYWNKSIIQNFVSITEDHSIICIEHWNIKCIHSIIMAIPFFY